MIRYAEIIDESVVDGLGIRVTAFLQGCPRRCEACHNPQLLPMKGGIQTSERELAELLLSKVTPLHKGITFSGGDPLAQPDALLKVIFFIKRRNPRLNIWVYTGFVFDEIKHLPVMSLIDVLVDGPFILAQKNLSLPFRGSSNQRIINVPASLKSGKLIELQVEGTYQNNLTTAV